MYLHFHPECNLYIYRNDLLKFPQIASIYVTEAQHSTMAEWGTLSLDLFLYVEQSAGSLVIEDSKLK